MIHKELTKKIGYSFNDSGLLEHALRHCSMGKVSNERLEFLGDAVLNFIIAAELYHRYPEIKEGALSRIRSNLVNGEILAELANEFELGKYIQFGSGELKSGGAKRKSILADTVEAIIGAIYLDAGFEITEKHVLNWFTKLLDGTTGVAKKDPKTELQELMQMRKLSLPVYDVSKTDGAAHARVFTVSCKVSSVKTPAKGVGPNKRIAERNAAEKMLAKLKKNLNKV